ncbi:MAG: DUF2177 family protein [Rhodobacteraceae bacterium]|nr:DUF2177 family protein [Paracoccaceae bacterium]
MRHLIAYLTTVTAFLAIDFVWLTQVAGPFYFEQLGDLMADEVRYEIAGGFYLLYVVGIVYFCVSPALRAGSLRLAALNGALFGLIAYATYDLTNLATLRDWPAIVSMVDMVWGLALTCASASAGFILTRAILKPSAGKAENQA